MVGPIPRDSFQILPQSAKVLFGAKTRRALAAELSEAGVTRVLVLTTPRQVELGQAIGAELDQGFAGLFSGATMHTPVSVTQDAMNVVRQQGADCVLSVGGGSTIGLGKALSARSGVFHAALPTTYAGSEMTPILGETEDGVKTTRTDPNLRPSLVVYDPELTYRLPVAMSVTSAINAMAHAIEALYAQNGNPVVDLLAIEGIRALVTALPTIATQPEATEARAAALYGAWLCGTCLGNTSMALHHKLCHTLGGSFNLPHAQTHTVVLPHVLAFNAPKIPGVVEKLQPILGTDPARGLFDLAKGLDAPTALQDLGLAQADIARATQLALAKQYPNPRPVEPDAIAALLQRAWAGDPPKHEEMTTV